MDAAIGSDPSLADVVRMVHPKPADATREAFYGWLIGKPVRARRAAGRRCRSSSATSATVRQALPEVPFQMLTALELRREEWARDRRARRRGRCCA